MVYNGKPYENGWFGGTPIFGNLLWMIRILPWSISSSNCYSSNFCTPIFRFTDGKMNEQFHLKMQENHHPTQNLHFLCSKSEFSGGFCSPMNHLTHPVLCAAKTGRNGGACGSEAVPSRSRESRLTSPALRTSEFENRRDWWKGVKKENGFFQKKSQENPS